MRIPHFVKDSGTLLSGNLIAQGVAFAAYFVLGRLFTPEDFGLYNIFYSYIEVLIILSTCKYELSIVIAEDDREANAMTRLTLRLNTFVSLALLTIAAIVYFLIPESAGVNMAILHSPLLLLIPVMVFFCGTTRVYTFLCNRHKRYRPIALSEVVTSFTGVAAKVVMGLMNGSVAVFHAVGLPLGTIVGKMAGNVYYRFVTSDYRKSAGIEESVRYSQLMRKYRNFPLYAAPKELVSSLSANLPFLWLSVYFDNALLGLFSMALTFTSRPVNILANAFEKVFYASTAQQVQQRQRVFTPIRRFILILNALALPVVVLVFFIAEPACTFLFGEKWVGTGFYVRCILPWAWVLLTTNSLAFVANVFSTQRIDFYFQIVQMVLRVAALGAGCASGNFRLAIVLFCAVSTLVQLAQLVWYIVQLLRHDVSC